jgi:hypothetical protein
MKGNQLYAAYRRFCGKVGEIAAHIYEKLP